MFFSLRLRLKYILISCLILVKPREWHFLCFYSLFLFEGHLNLFKYYVDLAVIIENALCLFFFHCNSNFVKEQQFSMLAMLNVTLAFNSLLQLYFQSLL